MSSEWRAVVSWRKTARWLSRRRRVRSVAPGRAGNDQTFRPDAAGCRLRGAQLFRGAKPHGGFHGGAECARSRQGEPAMTRLSVLMLLAAGCVARSCFVAQNRTVAFTAAPSALGRARESRQ